MPSIIETLDVKTTTVSGLREIKPGQIAVINNYHPDREAEQFHVHCAIDDSGTLVSRSEGVDEETSVWDRFEDVKHVTPGDEYILVARTNIDRPPSFFRIGHKYIPLTG